jgi:hypothetical protein
MSDTHLEVRSGGVAIEPPFPAGIAFLVCVLVGAFAYAASVAALLLVAGVGAFACVLGAIQQRLYPRISAAPGRRALGSVTIADDTITVQTSKKPVKYARAAIIEGWLERRMNEASVVLAAKNGDLVTVEVQSPDDARRLLTAAGVSADRQVMKTRLAPLFGRNAAWGCLVIPVAIVSTVGLLATGWGVAAEIHRLIYHLSSLEDGVLFRSGSMALVFFGLLAAMFIGLIPPELVIGNDGVTIRAPFSKRFVPYRDVAAVRLAKNAVELALRGGRVVRLPVEDRFSAGIGPDTTNPVREAIHDRILEAMTSGEREGHAAALDALDRAGRPFDAWRDHLRALAVNRAEYRRIALSPDDIAGVLADPSSPRERRLGAAMALSRADDEGARARVRIAAQACADETLKRALEAAAEDELTEELLEAAVRERR